MNEGNGAQLLKSETTYKKHIKKLTHMTQTIRNHQYEPTKWPISSQRNL